MYVVYLCACSFCAHATFGRGALSSLATFAAVFIFAAVSITFCPVPFARFASRFRFSSAHFPHSCNLHSCVSLPRTFLPFHAFGRLCVPLPFCRSFHCKRLQRSFQTVLSRFKRLKFSACTFIPFAPFEPFV